MSGLTADARTLVDHARVEAQVAAGMEQGAECSPPWQEQKQTDPAS